MAKNEQGHNGAVAIPVTPKDQPRTPMDVLLNIQADLRQLLAVDMPADGEDYRDYPISAGAGEFLLDSDVQFGYVYIPNCPRDITVYAGYRGQLIGSFKSGAFVSFRMPRSTGVLITYAAGSAAQSMAIYASAREVSVSQGEILATPGTSATSLGKAEDSPHVSGDVGVEILTVRNDAQATLTSADGDYSPLAVDRYGHAITVPRAGTTFSADGNSSGVGIPLDAANVARFQAVVTALFNGATYDRPRTPNVFKTFNLAASSAEQTIWTPAAGKKFRLMGLVLTINTLAATVTFRDNTAGTTIFVTAGPAASIIQPSNLGNGILSATINNVLTIQASAVSALVGTVWGTEE